MYIYIYRYTTPNQKIIYKDDNKIVTEFPCLLGHPVYKTVDLYTFKWILNKEFMTLRAILKFRITCFYIHTCWPKKRWNRQTTLKQFRVHVFDAEVKTHSLNKF